CWERISELAREIKIDSERIQDFERITNDEDNHRRIFLALADVENTSQEVLIDRIAEVGQYFLPLRYRVTSDRFSSSDSVWCFAQKANGDKSDLFKQLLVESNFVGAIVSRAKAMGKPYEQMRIVIKASFMMIYDKTDISPIIDTNLLAQ